MPCQKDVAGPSCSSHVQGAKWRHRERAGEKIKERKRENGGKMEGHIPQSVCVEVTEELLGVISFHHVKLRDQAGCPAWKQVPLPLRPSHQSMIFCGFEKWSHNSLAGKVPYVAEDHLKILILLPPSSKCGE